MKRRFKTGIQNVGNKAYEKWNKGKILTNWDKQYLLKGKKKHGMKQRTEKI